MCRITKVLLAFLGFAFFSLNLQSQPVLSVESGHVNSLIPGQEATAGYLRIHNSGNQDALLVDFESPAAAMVQLHETNMNNGMMSMNRVESITVPAGGDLLMQPGGLHLMIMGVDKAAFAGESIELKLQFEDGTVLDAQLPVQSMHGGH